MDLILSKLEDYGISRRTGFVPDNGSKQLPLSLRAWEALALALPVELASASLLKEMEKLPDFEVDALEDQYQWQRAYIVLGFLTHALVHGARRDIVPASLGEPFLAVVSHLGLRPVLSYAGLCLFNWSRSSHQDLLGGLQCEMSFTGTPDEAAFYLVPVLAELEAGHLPARLIQTLMAAAGGDWDTVTQDLDVCSKTITNMTELLDQLRLCHPQVFYHRIRPFIEGLDVSFEKPTGPPLHVKHVGGSVVQGSLFMFLDHVLGVSHQSNILRDMRAYMPGGHRRFLEDVTTNPSLQALMDTYDAPPEAQTGLVKCRENLQTWRSKHIAIVTRYIVLPAQTAARANGKEGVNVSGTAGSSPLPFLKQMKEETGIVDRP